MSYNIKNASIEWNNRTLFVEVGKLARQATGSVYVSYGKTSLLVTVTAKKIESLESCEFNISSGLALIVNFLSKSYATGKIPAGFFKREGKSTERDVLASRIIDRAIRPLIPSNLVNEVNVICKLLTYDRCASPEISALIGASIALYIAGVPFKGPVVGVSLDENEDNEIFYNQGVKNASLFHLFAACAKNSVVMIEAEGNESSENSIIDNIDKCIKNIEPVIGFIENFQKQLIINEDIKYFLHSNTEIKKEIQVKFEDKLSEPYSGKYKSKVERNRKSSVIHKEIFNSLNEKYLPNEIKYYIKEIERDLIRAQYTEKQVRIDGRDFNSIRNIEIEIDYLPGTHGSAIFTRGGTQSLAVVTLGSYQDEQIVDDIDGERRENILLHYNFLPYAVGEVGALRAPGRREIGHGRLALKAIEKVFSKKDQFPYTVRIVSEITESDGSSSMATVCASSLALMDTGVPIKTHVAGIAMGLVKCNDDFVILSDISGDEDSLGDMDFKVAGTRDGVTALQMDIKIDGISIDMLEKALFQAREGRMHILKKMEDAIPESRNDIKESAPKIYHSKIPKEMIHKIIGSGGKTIKGLCEEHSVKIDINDISEGDSDNSNLYITGENKENILNAKAQIDGIINPLVIKIGQTYEGVIVNITDFGLFVEISPMQQGLIHRSFIAKDRDVDLRSLFNERDKMVVKVKDITGDGKIRLIPHSNNSNSHSSPISPINDNIDQEKSKIRQKGRDFFNFS